MNVKEMIEELKKYDENSEVFTDTGYHVSEITYQNGAAYIISDC